MRTFLLSLFSIAVVIIGALLLAPAFIPQEWYREPIVSAIEEQTGREVTIEGDIGLTFFPQFSFQVDGVSIANVEGAKHPTMASMKTLDIGFDVVRLLNREIIVSRFVLEEPVIHVEIDTSGKSNLEFEPAEGVPEEETSGPSESPDGSNEDYEVGTISLGDVRLVNGLVTYTNHQTKEDYEARDINANLSLPNYEGPFSADGALTWQGETLNASVAIGHLKDFVEGNATTVSTQINSNLITQTFDGETAGDQLESLVGRATLDIPSVRKLASWLGSPLPAGDGFGPFKVSGDLTARNERLLFKNADVQFDDINAKGGLTLILDGEKPYVSGRMDADILNLNPYLSGDTSSAASGTAGGSSGGGSAAGGSSGPGQQGGATASSDWSSDPIDLAGLNSLNANLKLTAKQVLFGGIKLNNSDLDLKINDGLLTANLAKIALYKGSGSAQLIADGRGRTPKISQKFSLNAIDLLPLFQDAGGVDRLEGTGNMILDVTMSGRSQKQMMRSLNGTGKVTFLDGAIRGVNLADLVRNIRGVLGGGQNTGIQKTDFAELSGNFSIRNGILSNRDLVLLNPLLRLTGAGTIDIPNRTLKYRFVPTAVSTIEGQGGKRDVTGISVPVIVSGTWDNPTFTPDVGAIIGGILGGGGQSDDENSDTEPANPLETILKGVLGVPDEGEADESNTSSEGQSEDSQPSNPLEDIFNILQNQ